MRAYLNEKEDDADCLNPDRLGYAWKALEPHFADLLPDEVDRNKCRAYQKTRLNLANGTINKELRTPRVGLAWQLGIKENPAVFDLNEFWLPLFPVNIISCYYFKRAIYKKDFYF